MEAINQYVYRGHRPKPLPVPAPKKILSPSGQRLSTIVETGSVTGPNPRDSVLSHSTNVHNGVPPPHSAEKRPPSYATQSATGAGLPSEPSRLRQILERRGGWRRLALIILVPLLILAIALGVGLGVGLSQHNSSSGASQSTSSPTATPAGPFPIGAYSFPVFSTNVTTACTPDPMTWRCFPYTTYESSPSGSATTFAWIISASPQNSTSYQISSSQDPLSIVFPNTSLALVDQNLPTERYTFAMPMLTKNVLPAISLTGDNIRTTCFYNATTLQASLYTRMNATLQADSTTIQRRTLKSAAFGTTWPGAVMVQQIATGGQDVPNCYRLSSGYPTGPAISLPIESSTDRCSCEYSNYET